MIPEDLEHKLEPEHWTGLPAEKKMDVVGHLRDYYFSHYASENEAVSEDLLLQDVSILRGKGYDNAANSVMKQYHRIQEEKKNQHLEAQRK